MSDPEQQSGAELRTLRLEKLNRADARYRSAFVQTQKVLADYDCMSPSDGNLALERALKLQNEATNKYAAMLKELMNLMVRSGDGTLTKPDAQKQHNPSTALGKPKALSPNEYQILLEQAPMLIWRANTSAECDYFNDRWLQFRGRRMDQECENQWAEGVHPEDLQRCLTTYGEAFENRQSFERLRTANHLKWNIGYDGTMGNIAGYSTGVLLSSARTMSSSAISAVASM
jgi:PAS domain-containing protein